MLPEKAILEFIELYKREYGVILNLNEARILSLNLLLFFKTISSEISKPTNKIINLNQKGGKKYVTSSNCHSI
jgi:hypothetical protein